MINTMIIPEMAVYIITSKAYADSRYKIGITSETPTGLISQYKRTLSEPVIKLFITTVHYRKVEEKVLKELADLRVPHDTGIYSEYIIWDYDKLSRLVMRTIDDCDTNKAINNSRIPLSLSRENLEEVCRFFNIPMKERDSTEYYLELLRNYKAKKMYPGEIGTEPKPSYNFGSAFDSNFSFGCNSSSFYQVPPERPPVKKIHFTEETKERYLLRVHNEIKKINPNFKLFYMPYRCVVGLDCLGKLVLPGYTTLPKGFKEYTSNTDIWSTEMELENYIKDQIKRLI